MWCRTRELVLVLLLAGLPLLKAQAPAAPTERGAVIRSLILPGWGQHTLGARTAARRMMTIEAGLWMTFFLARGAADWYLQDFQAFAALHAGVEYRHSRPDIYYYRVGRYDSIEEYNQTQLRQRNRIDVYPLDSGLDWHWVDSTHRERYQELRHASIGAAKVASFAVGGMVVNRAVAAIHVLFLSRRSAAPTAHYIPLLDGGMISISLQLGYEPARIQP
ncbi:MAG: hypothetical protein JSW54_12915 [Fidelibacterota bacterium]|nr:MAG: hypothetical protein JSW54_12915 [Candidatus Neomarinimicrobiota bacterium]